VVGLRKQALEQHIKGRGMTSQRTRDRMVERLWEQGVLNTDVLEVMRTIPRHIFVGEALASHSYEDTALPIGHNQTISQPYIVAKMTELLLEQGRLGKVLEIGTGCGIISILLALKLKELNKDFAILAVDINNKALKLAHENAVKLGVERHITFINSNILDSVEHSIIGQTDIIVSNPPYIANNFKLEANVLKEPKNALFGGKIGDELLQKIIDKTIENSIKYLACEMGYDQKKKIENYLKKKNYSFKSLQFYKDWSDIDRGFTLELQ
jgi:release factor glutamine methyltransferase